MTGPPGRSSKNHLPGPDFQGRFYCLRLSRFLCRSQPGAAEFCSEMVSVGFIGSQWKTGFATFSGQKHGLWEKSRMLTEPSLKAGVSGKRLHDDSHLGSSVNTG